ncbi:MAG: hypothetical protein ONA90_10650 [candidate division KSB1 bacterium]|nr:hypothetical protein [candidate division KSB1 bacterium]
MEGNNVTALAAGRDNSLWMGTLDQGIFHIQPNCEFVCHIIENFTTQNLPPLLSNRINDIALDRDGNLWFATSAGVCRYNPEVKSFRCLDENNFPNLRSVNTVFNDPDDNLWFGLSEHGVLQFNNNWFSFRLEDFLSPFVQSLLLVKDTLWVGTTRGIVRYKNEARIDAILPNRIVNALAPSDGSHVWVGVYELKGGVFSYEATGKQRCYLDLDGTGKRPKRNQIQQIIQRDEEVWIAADSLLTRVRARDCSVIATYSRESTQGGLVNDQIFAIAFDKAGKLWCGTPAGVSVYDPEANQWSATYTTANGLFDDNNVTAIAVDPTNGEMWVGTARGGIAIFDGNAWRNLNRRTVLVDNFITKIVFSNSGEVFVATPRGVNRRDQQGLWTTFNFQSGLAADYVTSIALQGDSLRWFGTRGAGLTRYRPPKSLPQTFIETRFDVTDNSEVTYRFSAADLNTAPNEFRYRYWLDNDPPSEPTSDRFAGVQGLQPGPHTFYVQAIDRDGNLDPEPARDFFYRIDPNTGKTTVTVDASKIFAFDTVKIELYWPPYRETAVSSLAIEPADTVGLHKSAILAYDFLPYQTDIKDKGAILTFEFPCSAGCDSLAIYREIDMQGIKVGQHIGGTPEVDSKTGTMRISTRIREFGRYSVRKEIIDSKEPKEEDKIHVTPRIFSPLAGGHGQQTTLSFTLDQPAHVRIRVFNLAGRLVNTIWDDQMSAGINAVVWDGRDREDWICPSGLYIMVIESSGFKSPPQPQKVMVLNETRPQ